MSPPTVFFIKLIFIGVPLPYNVVLVSIVQQNESTVCSHISPPSLLDFLPIQVTTEHYIEFFVLYSRFLLVIYFLHNCVYMSIPIYQVIPSPRSLILHLCLQPTSPLNSTYLHFITYFPIFCLVFKLTQKILCMILGIKTRLFLEENKCHFPYTWFTILV